MKTLGTIITVALAAGLAPAAAPAATPRPQASSATGGVSYPGTNGGAVYGEPVAGEPAKPGAGKPAKPGAPKPPKPKRTPSSVAARPQLQAFRVSPTVITPGQTPTVSFQIKGRAPTIRLRLVVSWPGTTNGEREIDLGRRPANSPQSVALTALADPALPEGVMSVRIAGRDSAGRLLRPGVQLSRVTQVQVRGHVFPLRGAFSYGGPDARFGATRDGHTHQGQDLIAAEGLPVVAPRSGTVTYVGFQRGGAGWYVVLDGDGEDVDYAFMHLQEGSIPVVKGQHVDQGQRLGSVGQTGDAAGPHLHFEVWQGAWWAGGHPVDPLPYLQQWQQWSPVRAT
ncbi:MAG TPA: M23 family metallopeptidase [Thermoleophilaceae bacterium]|nr:M23 family metallopeptidase [Thermoleophilaceae bacterium]